MGKRSFALIKSADLPVSQWSGGTTTQLAIYPSGAVYAERDFIWRVSTARVEAEESLFTSLPGVSRIIMVLEGRMLLEHEGRYAKDLGAFEQDAFMGDWVTRSRGRVTDFNVMTTEGESALEVLELMPGESAGLPVSHIGEQPAFHNREQSVLDTGKQSAFHVGGQWAKKSVVLYFLSRMEIGLPGEGAIIAEAGDVLVGTAASAEGTGELKMYNPGDGSAKVICATILHYR